MCDGPVFEVECPNQACSEGEVFKCRWDGDWHSQPEDIYEPCPTCLGRGSVLSDEPQVITLEELQWRDDEIAEAMCL